MTCLESANFTEFRAPWDQSNQYFYTLRKIYKRVLKHKINVLAQDILDQNSSTIYPKIFSRLHFSIRLNQQFRHQFEQCYLNCSPRATLELRLLLGLAHSTSSLVWAYQLMMHNFTQLKGEICVSP